MSHLTMGGIVAGIGGGSSSFRHGYFHEILTQFDIIIGNGELLTCSPNQNEDLFYGVPNTLGTLGYITQMTLAIRKCKPYVKTTNYLFHDSERFFNHLEHDLDFQDLYKNLSQNHQATIKPAFKKKKSWNNFFLSILGSHIGRS